MKDENDLRTSVLLTFQVSLLAMIPPHVRGITVDWRIGKISALCLFDGEIEDEERELCGVIETEVVASFPDYDVTVTPVSLRAPASLAEQSLKAWVYMRREE